MKRILFLFVVVFIAAACRKKEVDQFYITFSPSADVIVVDQERLQMNLKLFSSEGLASLDVYLSSDQLAERLVDSKTYTGTNLENAAVLLQFSPDFPRGTSVYGRFVLTDARGEKLEYLKRFDLTLELALSLYEDLSFYSADSDLYGAFSLQQASAVNFDGGNSQGLADIRELSNDMTIDPTMLTHRWYSPTQCGLARVPGLNFYEINKEQLGVTFDANVCMEFTDSLVVGDIYIFKKMINSIPSYYAIRITAFESGNQPGRYIFDLRK